MANGDKAAAKGWNVVAESDDHADGYDAINYVLDKVADEVDGRTAADNLKLDKAAIVTSSTEPSDPAVMFWAKPL